MWWAGVNRGGRTPTAQEQKIFDEGPGRFPSELIAGLGGTVTTETGEEKSAQVSQPSTSWQDPETGAWNRVSIDPNTGQTVVYRQENAVEVISVLDGVQVGRSQGQDIANDQANKSG